jgi:predicted RNA-binding Zn ribbon-like protein
MRVYWLTMSEHAHAEKSSFRTPPGDLMHVMEFVNTIDFEDDIERFDTPDALRDWFAERGWLNAGERLTEADLRQALEVREALRSLLLANNGHPLDERAVESLNAAARRAEVLVRFGDDGGGALAPARSGIDGALGRLLAVVFRSMAEGSWPRLKACPEHSCMWAFYDRSKNRSGTWCDMAVCGNRAKARAYRERRAKQR